jgi:Tol biopolymer transport system component
MVTLKENGGRVDWSWANDLIAFDRVGDDGYYGVYTMAPDGAHETCLTCAQRVPGAGRLPPGHKGNPAWYPSGDHLVFQVEKENHPGSSFASTPGFGTYSDLWLMTADGSEFYQLTDLPISADRGVLHPHFSADGSMLSWSELVRRPNLLEKRGQFGYWQLNVADFAIGPSGPTLSNIKAFQPGGAGFYENHGFSPDGTRLLFSASFDENMSPYTNTDIFTLSLADQTLQRLTTEAYNEHASYTPDGRHILWMSSRGNRNRGTDYWLMDLDGSHKRRVTYFNQPGCPDYTGDRIVMADSSWSPGGDRLAAYLNTNLIKQTGKTVRLDFEGLR